jgi:hypothetical protein
MDRFTVLAVVYDTVGNNNKVSRVELIGVTVDEISALSLGHKIYFVKIVAVRLHTVGAVVTDMLVGVIVKFCVKISVKHCKNLKIMV